MKSVIRIAGALAFGALALLAGCNDADAPKLLASAKSYLASGDRKSAVIQLKNALQADPKLGEARFLLAQTMLANEDPASASLEFEKALQAGYPPSLVVPPLARALILQGQEKALVDKYAQVDLPDPAAKADLMTSLGTAYGMHGLTDKSRAALDEALKAVPGYGPALHAQVHLLIDERRFDEALALSDKTIAAAPLDADAWQLKGEALLYGKNDPAGALAAYRQALKAQKDHGPARFSLVKLLIAQNDLPEATVEVDALRKTLPNHPQTIYFDAQLASIHKNDKRAHELTQQLLKLAPNSIKVLELAGQVDLNLHLLPEAEHSLGRAVQLSGGSPSTRHLLAQTYLRMGQPAKALDTLAPLSGGATPDPTAIELAAEAYVQTGETAKADAFFAKAASLDPKDVKSRVALAMGALKKGDGSAGIAQLRALAAKEQTLYVDLALVSAYLGRKDYANALKAVDAVAAKDSASPLAADLRGNVLLLAQDTAGARRNFERALAVDPSFVPAASSLARMDLADRRPDLAKQRFEAVLKVSPNNLDAMLALVDLKASAGAPSEEITAALTNAIKANPTMIRPRILLIDHLLARKAVPAALMAAQSATAALPNDPQAVDALGRAQMASGDSNQALVSFTRLVSMDAQSPTAYLRLAGTQLARKNRDAAIDSVRRALAVAPGMLSAQQLLVDLEIQAGKPQEALAVARDVQKQRPGEAVGYILEGVVEESRQNLARAAEVYQGALTKAPPTDAAVKLHAAWLAAQKPAEADKFAASWLAAHPRDVGFLSYLGRIALSRHDEADARSRFEAVLKIAPDDTPALNNLAWIMTERKQPGAVAYAQKAVALAPNVPAFQDTLAGALAAENKLDDAVAAQTRAVGMAPGEAGFRLNLAKLYLQAGDKTKARRELEALGGNGDNLAVETEATKLLKTL